jgi:hypothetical protein
MPPVKILSRGFSCSILILIACHIERCKNVCKRADRLRYIYLSIVSSTRILMPFFNSSHISSVMADDMSEHVICDFLFLSRFSFAHPQFIVLTT